MSDNDNIVEITETSNYTISIDTSLIQNENNIIIDLSTPNSVDIINNTTTLISDLPQGYPLSWTTENLPISRVSGLIGESGIYYNNGIIGISGIPYNLIPVHDIIAGSGIGITDNNGIFNVSVTGNFGLTSEEVDDRVYDLLKAGNYTNIVYNDNLNTLTISVTGLQPSGSYSLAGHNHNIIEVSGLQSALDSKQPSGNYASGIHYHTSSDILNFNSSISGLLPNISGTSPINVLFTDNIYTLTITGLQPSGNYANAIHTHVISDVSGLQTSLDNKQPVGSYASGIHTHLSDDISDFNTSVIELLPVTNILGSSGIIVSNSGTIFNIISSGLAFNSGANFDSLSVTGVPVSISGHSHSYSDISDWADGVEQEVHTLLVAGNNINIIYDNIYDTLTINTSGLQPSGNYSVVGHLHTISNISGLQTSLDSKQPSGNYSLVGHGHSIADITNLQFSLDLKAPINSPSFSGIPTAPTAASGTNSNQIASTAFVRNEISNLVDSAPNTLDTLNELAAALGDDPNFATTITNLIGNKVSKSGDTMIGTLIINPTGIDSSGLVISESSNTNLQNVLTIDSNNFVRIYGQDSALFSTEDNSLYNWTIIDSSIQNSVIGNILPSSGYFTNLLVNNIPVSISGHSHVSSDITNFNTSVSGLLPSMVGSGYVNLSFNNNTYTINVTGLQPSGNYSLVGHTHTSSQITDFNNSVSGLLPTIVNSGNNKILTSTGSSVGINAENNLTFDGNLLKVIGSIESSGEISAKTSSSVPEDILLFYGDNYWDGTVFSVDGRGAGYFQYGLSVDGYLNVGGNINLQGSGLLTSNINNFDSSVSGLLPVKNILSGTGISVSNSSGIYTINSIVNEVQQAASLVTNVFNKTANTISKGSVVYINGGQGDQPTIELAIASTETGSSKTYGITAENISSMSAGKVIVAGALTGFNTDQYNPSAPHDNMNGVTLWLSPVVSGTMTTTKPSAPYHMVSVGTIVRTHQNEGVIEVRIQNGFELEELHNVAISGVSDGQFLQYNSSSGLWVPSSSGNFSILNVNGTGVSVNGHTHTSSEITDFNNSVSGLLPSITGSTYINSSLTNNVYTISTTGLQPLLTNPVTGVGTSGYLSKWTGSNSVSSGIIFDNGTNVGIGIDTPAEKLEISGSLKFANCSTRILRADGNNLKFYSNASNALGHYGIFLDNTSVANGRNFRIASWADGTTGKFIIRDDSNGQDRFTIQANGDIGIGTTSPSHKLDVSGVIRSSSYITAITDFRLNNQAFSRVAHADTNGGFVGGYNAYVSGLTPLHNSNGAISACHYYSDGSIRFLTNSSQSANTAASETMRINSLGRVGIGTTTPSGHLDVAGDVYVRGTGNNLGTIYFKSQAVGDKALYIGATNGGDLVMNGVGANIQLSSQGGYLNLLGTSTQIHIGHGYNAGNTSQIIRFLPAAKEMMRMTTSGTLGIGLPTSASSYAGNTVQLFNQQPYANTRVHIAGSGVDSGSAALIVTNSDISPLLYVRNDGNVGIGSSSPAARLTVSGNLRLEDNATGNTGNKLQLYRGGGGANDYTIGKEGNHLAISTANDSNAQRAVQIGSHSGSTWVPKIHMNGWTGAIGIGTTSPSGQLNVVGTGIISSRLGIGTNNPSVALDVIGDANIGGILSVSGIPIGEIIDDEVAGLLVAGSGINLNYNDNANTLTISNQSTIISSTNLYLWSNFQ